ncbi:MAG TPA: GNAT family N-acetyltransferase [Phycisphaerales bacterium]|nr:GNAT family N-acetyltransferase [Phycisphaerales bacterium]
MRIEIVSERPDTVAASRLIAELEAVLDPHYPPASRHGYSVEKLLREGVAFFVARCDGAESGCCGIQYAGTEYGEVKRMYVRPALRGRGLGRRMLEHLAAHASERGVRVLRLETGIHQREAIRLYERFGFVTIPPFGPYREDPLSRCYQMPIG